MNGTYISDLDLMHFSVPPTKIEISGHRSGSRLEVRENEEVELRCIVHDAKPKANVVWYRQNAQYNTGEKCSTFKVECCGRQQVNNASTDEN